MSYEDDVIIDCDALDVEWLDQARRMGRYCKLVAEARRKMDLAKENLEFVRATVERAIRLDPGSYGVIPGPRGITEDSIKAAVIVHDEYQMANRDLIDARYEHDVADGAVRAFDHRKSALERLVQLHGQNYFAGPVTPRDLHEERARRDQDAQRRVRIGSAPSGQTSERPTMRRRS